MELTPCRSKCDFSRECRDMTKVSIQYTPLFYEKVLCELFDMKAIRGRGELGPSSDNHSVWKIVTLKIRGVYRLIDERKTGKTAYFWHIELSSPLWKGGGILKNYSDTCIK